MMKRTDFRMVECSNSKILCYSFNVRDNFTSNTYIDSYFSFVNFIEAFSDFITEVQKVSLKLVLL